MNKNQFALICLGLAILFVSPISKAQTTLKKEGFEWRLFVDNKPFEIKGVTFRYDNIPAKYDSYFRRTFSDLQECLRNAQ